MITYEITKKNKDITKATITRSGHTNDFTIETIVSHMKELTKLKLEQESNQYTTKAFLLNLEKNHPYLKKLDAKQKVALGLYAEKSNEYKEATENIAMIEAQVKKYTELEAELVKQVGLDKNSPLAVAIADYFDAISEARKTFKKFKKDA